MSNINYNRIQFLKSAAEISNLPPDQGAEIAFAGRSNSGKSTAINTITRINGLARASKTPGRTQLINFFELDPQRRLVDLPGYGYAKVPEAIKVRWQKTLEEYLHSRNTLRGVVLMMDIRHVLRELDWQMIHWAVESELPMHILLTKADKLKRGAAQNTLLLVKRELNEYSNFISVQLFSAVTGQGVEDVKQTLDQWLTLENTEEDTDNTENKEI